MSQFAVQRSSRSPRACGGWVRQQAYLAMEARQLAGFGHQATGRMNVFRVALRATKNHKKARDYLVLCEVCMSPCRSK